MGDSPPYGDCSSHAEGEGESVIEKQFKALDGDKRFIMGSGSDGHSDVPLEKVNIEIDIKNMACMKSIDLLPKFLCSFYLWRQRYSFRPLSKVL